MLHRQSSKNYENENVIVDGSPAGVNNQSQ